MWAWIWSACARLEGVPEPDGEDLDLTGLGPAVAAPSVPLSGGSTLVLADGRVVAADVDGDRVVIVDPEGPQDPAEVLLPSGWAPAGLATDGDTVYVALRGTGAVLSIATRPLSLLGLVPACSAPRGMDLAPDGTLWVVCQGGELVSISPGEDSVARTIEPDLRDVLVLEDGTAWVTTLRHAQLLRVELPSGAILSRSTPTAEANSVPRVAWRTVRHPDGGISMLHQAHSLEPIALEPDPDDPHAAMYGGAGLSPCSARVSTRVTSFEDDGTVRTSVTLETPFAHDLLWDGSDLLVAGNGLTNPPRSELLRFASADLVLGVCVPGTTEYLPLQGAFVSGVALLPDGAPIVSTRNTFGAGDLYHPLAEPSPGFDLFHRVAGPSNLACASCHADGAEDGHTWSFVDIGPRRTPDLGGGLLATAPYHWDGDLSSVTALILDTAVARMGHPFPPSPQVDALAGWLDALPARRAASSASPEILAQGQALFLDPSVGCAACHAGPALTTAATLDVGTGKALQVPSLLGVGVRLPVMHDGCGSTFERRLTDPLCGGTSHGATAGLAPDEVAALAAYLSSL